MKQGSVALLLKGMSDAVSQKHEVEWVHVWRQIYEFGAEMK